MFARNMGFKIEDDLNTENSRELGWNGNDASIRHIISIRRNVPKSASRRLEDAGRGLIDREDYYGTINCNGINSKGEICGVTTTSGLAWKIPGRVGDSPILGAGLYVDGTGGRGRIDRARRSESL